MTTKLAPYWSIFPVVLFLPARVSCNPPQSDIAMDASLVRTTSCLRILFGVANTSPPGDPLRPTLPGHQTPAVSLSLEPLFKLAVRCSAASMAYKSNPSSKRNWPQSCCKVQNDTLKCHSSLKYSVSMRIFLAVSITLDSRHKQT